MSGALRSSTVDNESGLMPLEANGKILSMAPNRFGYLNPTDASTDIATLRQQYQQHGYLWLKGFLKRQDVLDFRAWVFSRLMDTGLLQPGSDPMVGVAATGDPDKALADKRLMALVRSVAYEGFCTQPRIAAFMDEFLQGISYLHKRKIMRFTRPNTGVVTPAHYDLVYLRGGTSRIVTAWIPIGDIPVDMGGLVYLEGSHRIGADMEKEFEVK
ncbi:MAG: phytanoyl-CoA dioxygenase family protein, partial [Rhizobiaceae bacterium]|nr:phytanoyl-CoA dioxygenase family protein [Rhizobiaceae bacterium]